MKPRRKRFPPHVYAGIVKRQGGICACGCGEPLGSDPRAFEFDHEIPLWKGGEDHPDNLRARKKKHHLPKTQAEATERAKVKRVEGRDGMRKRRMNRHDKRLAALLEEGEDDGRERGRTGRA